VKKKIEVIFLAYIRPKSDITLSKEEKIELLREYYDYYKELTSKDINALNKKLPREALSSLLDNIGTILLEESKKLAEQDGPVKEFLKENPLPNHMDGLLPKDFRVFCLVLNALKQWVSAEQGATDRYLLGGTARETCRSIVTHCMVTREELGKDAELHHPIRDGRPPIILSKKGHSLIEGQSTSEYQDTEEEGTPYDTLLKLKHSMNRSWVQLRKGCLDLLGQPVEFTTQPVKNTSRAFAKKASEETGLTYRQLLDLLDDKELGL